MKESDLEIMAVNPRPPGGQQVGMTVIAVKVTHKPTGLSAYSESDRSQHKNLRICKAMVEMGLAELGWKDELSI